MNATARFARWFRRESFVLRATPLMEALDEIHLRLERVHPDLCLEIGQDGVERELVLSAGGNPELFELVRELAKHIGEVPGWTIQALKPARGVDFVHKADGVVISVPDLRFEPMAAASHPGEISIALLAPEGVPLTEEMAWRIVQAAIGEEDAAFLDHLQVGVLPLEHEELLKIERLAEYVRWHRARRNRTSS